MIFCWVSFFGAGKCPMYLFWTNNLQKKKKKTLSSNRKQVDLTCHICLMLFDVWHNLYWGLFSRIFITYDLILDCGWKLCRWLMKRVRNPNLASTCPPCRHNYDLWPDGWPWLGAVNGNWCDVLLWAMVAMETGSG